MARRRAYKLIHLVGMLWIVLCLGYIFVMVLRQVGFHWWVIFSLSGYSAVLVFMLLSLYVFAVFRGVSPGSQAVAEHLLTSTTYYELFYVLTPFLGSVAGLVGATEVALPAEAVLSVAMGSLAATFIVWVIVDPVVNVVETLVVPSSRQHRRQRLAQAKALKRLRREQRQRLLSDILTREQQQRLHWQQVLRPYAERLAELLAGGQAQAVAAQDEAVEIGVKAWRMGGLACMRQVHEMALSACRESVGGIGVVDYVGCWWDGIGDWQCPAFELGLAARAC